MEHVFLPSTLKRIEYSAFEGCKNLRQIKLPGKLEYIGMEGFASSGLTEIVFPRSLRIVGIKAFLDCEHLRKAWLNEGLRVLGEHWNKYGDEFEGMAFAQSGIESIRIPSTLATIGPLTFLKCKNLKRIEFSEGLERIGPAAFCCSGIENIVLPASTKTVTG